MERFSDQHPFTEGEIAETNSVVGGEVRGKKLLIEVTTGHRKLALNQFLANQVAYVVTVPTLFYSALVDGVATRSTLNVWLTVAISTWLFRLGMYYQVFRVPPSDLAKSVMLRLIPLAMISMSTAFWVWSILLFVGPQLSPTVVVLFTGLLALGIAMIGMWPAAPAAAASQLFVIWGAILFRLVESSAIPWTQALSIGACVAVVLWLAVYVPVIQVRPHLARSDQIDLLMAELKRSNSDLEAMKDEMFATLQRRSSFFAQASHDIRQRLFAMKAMVLSTIVSLKPDDRSRDSLQRVSDEVEDLEQELSQVLEFARMETIDTKPQVDQVELQRIFQKLALHFEDVAFSREVDLRVRVTKMRITTDAAMLQRIMENLVSNALKFTRGRVLVAARPRGQGATIEVWDQGKGIRADERDRIFEAFHQDPTSKVRGTRGVGLGLAVVKRFVDALGYAISINSAPGRGSVFRVNIPAREGATPLLDTPGRSRKD
ncbi:HAMP domain-containing sensor histidine kinase [Variovorax sp. YR216]|uniref:sensor histidine kinase n=1 Tax=Variovorax sp. YR216 TaxID=1882828 RepID=UPI000899474F|nr:HAMP domain-containing sensor histidine kinase [Variovorax sp. YR216]SEB26350.1 Signal transduction histidine kinase [Variovorax sp. YR216]